VTGARPLKRRAGRRRESGFILVAVLWMIVALALLSSVYSHFVSTALASSHIPDERVQAEEAIRSAIELAAYQLLSAPRDDRPTNGVFTVQLGKVGIAAQYRSEGARIDLNAAPKELLTGLFISVGVNDAAAANYADRIIGWRKKAEPEGVNEEASLYKTAGLPYPPRQGPFVDPLELSLVLGIPPFIVDKVLPFVTIYNGKREVDVLNADPEILSALPGMTPAALGAALAQRARFPDDKQALIATLGPAGGFATTEGRNAYRALVSVALDRKRHVHADVVFLLLDEGDDPYRILNWRDDFDQPL